MGTSNQSLLYFHKLNDQGKPIKVYDQRVSDYIIKNIPMFCINGLAYIYQHGVYLEDVKETYLRKCVKACIVEELINYGTIDRIVKLIMTDDGIQRTEEQVNLYPDSWINFKNGMLDADTMELLPHKKEYYAVNQIPHEWKPDSDTEESVILQFIKNTIPNTDDQKMLLEFIGYTLSKSNQLQKSLILEGKGGTGKSELLRMLYRILGKNNHSSLSLQTINNNRFATSTLFLKIANIFADLPSTPMTDISAFKTIVGNDGSISAERKGKDFFQFHPYSKLLFSTNKTPKSLDDDTNAYYRRLLILPIKKRGAIIPRLAERLQPQEEIDALIVLGVKGYHDALARGRLFESKNSLQAVLDLYADTNSVIAWMISRTTRSEGTFVKRTELYGDYIKWCKIEERRTKSKKNFYADLRSKGYSERKRDGTIGFIDLELNEWGFCPDFSWEDVETYLS